MDKYNKYEWIPILYKEAIDKISTNNKKIKQKEYVSNGKYPVIDQGQEFIGGFTNDESKLLNCTLPALVFGDHTKIVKLVNYKFAPGADGVKVVVPRKFFNAKLFEFFTKILALKIPDKGYARHFQYIEKSKIPLPPLLEQRAIVSKIEQLFSDLDNGIDNFKKAQEQLRIYRQAVLKKAFEGDSTPKNDLQQFYKNVDDLPMDEKVRRGVPKFFKKCKLSGSFGKYYSIAELLRKGILIDVKDGNHGGNHPKKSDFTEQGLPFVTANVVNNFKIDYSKAYKVNGMPLKKLKVGFAKTGDVILTHKGSVGRVAIANQEIVCTPQTTYYKVNENYLISKYLMYFFASTVFYNQLAEVKSQTTRDFVSISKQFNLFILLLPIKEQSQIVQEIETRLSICDKMETTMVESLQKREGIGRSP